MPGMTRTEQPDSSPHLPATPSTSWLDRVAEMPLLTYLEKWRGRIRTHPETGLPLKSLRDQTEGDDTLSIEKLAFRTGRGLTLALALFPPACLAVFLLSFLITQPLLHQILLSAAVAGLIGYGTNWVAVQMLFRPREVRPILGQGLIPSQRDEIIRKVADEVVDKLINEHIIRQELDDSRLISRLVEETVREVRRLARDPELVRDTKSLVLGYASKLARSEPFREDLVREVETRIERVVGRSFTSWIASRLRGVWREPLIRIIDQELERLPETLDRLIGELDQALDHVPAYLEQKQVAIDAALTRIVMALIREMDVYAIILKQLSTVTSEQLEESFREFADDKLSYITLIGGVLGVVGGFVLVWPIGSALALAALATFGFALDWLLFSLLERRRLRRAAARSAAAEQTGAPQGEAAE